MGWGCSRATGIPGLSGVWGLCAGTDPTVLPASPRHAPLAGGGAPAAAAAPAAGAAPAAAAAPKKEEKKEPTEEEDMVSGRRSGSGGSAPGRQLVWRGLHAAAGAGPSITCAMAYMRSACWAAPADGSCMYMLAERGWHACSSWLPRRPQSVVVAERETGVHVQAQPAGSSGIGDQAWIRVDHVLLPRACQCHAWIMHGQLAWAA